MQLVITARCFAILSRLRLISFRITSVNRSSKTVEGVFSWYLVSDFP